LKVAASDASTSVIAAFSHVIVMRGCCAALFDRSLLTRFITCSATGRGCSAWTGATVGAASTVAGAAAGAGDVDAGAAGCDAAGAGAAGCDAAGAVPSCQRSNVSPAPCTLMRNPVAS
jgi:hypothetical protein